MDTLKSLMAAMDEAMDRVVVDEATLPDPDEADIGPDDDSDPPAVYAVDEDEEVEKQARWPAGSPGSKGGQFAPEDGTGNGGPQRADGGPPESATEYRAGQKPQAIPGPPFRRWKPPTDPDGWAIVPGQNDVGEPPFEAPPKGKHIGAGVIIREPDGRVWVVKPKGGYGGYDATFPKGTLEEGLSLQATAIKEAWEESGLKVEITGFAGDVDRTTSRARYYFARRVTGTPVGYGPETEGVVLAPPSALHSILNHPTDQKMAHEFAGAPPPPKPKVKAWKPAKAQTFGDWWDAVSFEGFSAPQYGLKGPLKKGLLGGAATFAMLWKEAAGQPRAPKGVPIGGQWVAAGTVGGPFQHGVNTAKWPAANSAAIAAKKKIAAIEAMVASGDAFGLTTINLPKPGGSLNPYQKGILAAHAKATSYLAAKKEAVVTASQSSPPADPGLPTTAIVSVAGWKKVGPQMGSNPGGLYEDPSGKQWYVKQSKSENHARNEVLAAKLYGHIGGQVPDYKFALMEDGSIGTASPIVKGTKFNKDDPAHRKAAQQDFAAHAILANWDAVGMTFDNQMILDGGFAMTIDTGGSLLFRAQGAPKGGVFGNSVTEFDTLRDPKVSPQAAAVFGDMEPYAMWANRLAAKGLKDYMIDEAVEQYGPGTPEDRKALAAKIKARRDDFIARADALIKGQTPTEPAAQQQAEAAQAAQAPKTREPKPLKLMPYGYGVTPQAITNNMLAAGVGVQGLYNEFIQKVGDKGHVGNIQGVLDMPTTGSEMADVIKAHAVTGMINAKKFNNPAYNPEQKALLKEAYEQVLFAPDSMSAEDQASLQGYAAAAYKHGPGWLLVKNPSTDIQKQFKKAALETLGLAHYNTDPDPIAETLTKPIASKVAEPPPAVVPGVAHKPVPLGVPKKPSVPASNASAQKKFDEIEQAALSGDIEKVKAIATKAEGGNTYTKKQHAYKMAVLAAMQSGAKVVSDDGSMKQGKPTTIPKAPHFNPSVLPKPPSFSNWSGAGKGLSSKAENNAANDAEVATLLAIAQTGDLDKLKATPIKSPSKHVASYKQDLVDAINDALTPYQPPPELKTVKGNIDRVAASLPTAPIGTVVNKMKSANKVGDFWILSGKASDAPTLGTAAGAVLPKAIRDAAYAKHSSLSLAATKAISSIQAGGFQSYTREGQWTNNMGNGETVASAMRAAWKEASISLPEGTTLYRNLSIPANTLKELLAIGVGGVIQEPGTACFSYQPDTYGSSKKHKIIFVAAKGARALPSFASGEFSSEKEVTIMPSQRYMIRKLTKNQKGGYDIEVVGLPLPDEMPKMKGEP